MIIDKYGYDNFTIDGRKELLMMLNFLLDNDMINASEYNFWEYNDTIGLEQKITLLTFALNDIENMLDDICNNRDLTDIEKAKNSRYIKVIRAIIEKHLYLLEGVKENENNRNENL